MWIVSNYILHIRKQLHSVIQFNVYVKEIKLVLRSEVETGKTRAPNDTVKNISFLMKFLKKAENI